MLFAAAAAVVALVLVISGVYVLSSSAHRERGKGVPTPPAAEAQAGWQPITNARVAREATATTEADGTIWIFGGIGADNRVSGRHEGYDAAIDIWKGGDDLPVPVQHAMSVTWQGNPIVLGGWRAEGTNQKVATDRVWRVVNSRWVELPPLLQPRAAAAAAVVGDRIVVTGGVDANGKLLNTTEIFDGNSWTLGAPMPTPRQMLAAASDGKLVYAVGGTNGTADLTTVEAYDPAANTWTTLPDLARRAVTSAWRSPTGGWWRSGASPRGRPQERGGARSRHEDLDRFAGHGHCAARHGGRRGGQVRVCDRRVDRRWRRSGDVLGGSAEAGTAQAAARITMAVPAGRADGQVEDGVDSARRQDLGRRRHAATALRLQDRRELRPTDGSVAIAAVPAHPLAPRDGDDLSR